VLLRLLKDPLTLFLVLGAGCYALWALANPPRETIVVTGEMIEALEADYRVLQGAEPDAEAREALIDRWVRDRILFLEALDRGLHLSDPKTEHRLVDKMRFLLMDTPEPPTEAQLRDHYVAHADAFTTDWRLTFEQRFWSDPAAVPDDVAERLAAGDPPPGETYWLGDRMTDYHAGMLRQVFGVPFTEALLTMEPGRWQGPFETARGIHWVRLEERRPPQLIPFEAARDALVTEWIEARQRESIARYVDGLADDYRVVVEGEATR
jgi:peptidyl-prolyl cis-trans isomerase C